MNNLFNEHEETIANPLLKYLSNNKNFRLIGQNNIKNKNRAPTVSFISKHKSAKSLSKFLIKNKIATRNDNFYAWRCLNALGINTDDGVVRISLLHYNTESEIKNLIKILDNFHN